MKKLLLCLFAAAFCLSTGAQGLKDLMKKGNEVLKGSTGKSALSNEEIISGLKEALNVGANNSTDKLSAVDGFFRDAAIKILMPEEAKKVEKTLRNVGMGKQVDNAILSMNRAAEDAAKSAAPIFLDAIKGMSIGDGLSILKGGDHAATEFLKNKTTASLTEAFRPIIEQSLQKTGATKHWNTVFTTYNKFSTDKVNTDLVAYVTEKALAGIFYQVALEEQKIRKDPMARTTDLLKKVFAN
jgi:hypothetical protein